ncbi:hypothetical protein DBR06_SOUSAS5410078 [Sousa chinensis]|nr:hypothetical protein DBR06_SOUSAS5410078 [Sousa chinensis]|eukprot:bmy_16942T0
MNRPSNTLFEFLCGISALLILLALVWNFFFSG